MLLLLVLLLPLPSSSSSPFPSCLRSLRLFFPAAFLDAAGALRRVKYLGPEDPPSTAKYTSSASGQGYGDELQLLADPASAIHVEGAIRGQAYGSGKVEHFADTVSASSAKGAIQRQAYGSGKVEHFADTVSASSAKGAIQRQDMTATSALGEASVEAAKEGGAEAEAPDGTPVAGNVTAKKALSFALKLSNVPYPALVADSTLFDGVSTAMKKIVAKDAQVESEHVAVAVAPGPSSGSTLLLGTVVPHNSSMDDVRAEICDKLQGIAAQVESAMVAYPNLDAITTGDVSATVEGGCNVEEFSDPRDVRAAEAAQAAESAEASVHDRDLPLKVIMLVVLVLAVLGGASCAFVNWTSWRKGEGGKEEEDEQAADVPQMQQLPSTCPNDQFFGEAYAQPDLRGCFTEWNMADQRISTVSTAMSAAPSASSRVI